MKIVLRKTSLADYPGKVSAVLFFPGCSLRCPWCHNRDLVLGKEKEQLVTVDESLAYLKKRRDVLGGAVLSGGEPCLWNELPYLIPEIKKLKLPVKLDTNGLHPVMLEKIFSREETRPDYTALDLKIAPSRYGELLPLDNTAAAAACPDGENKSPAPQDPGENLIQSASLLRRAGIAHEYRSLALPCGFITEKDIEALAPLADSAPWYFRPFRGGNCLDPSWDGLEESTEKALVRAEALAAKARELGKNGLCRQF